MKAALACLIIALSAVSINAVADYHINVFYESLCPYSRDFIWKSVGPFIDAIYEYGVQDEVFEEL